eukprot:4805360-Pleurochrysis_carterae.AAC.5
MAHEESHQCTERQRHRHKIDAMEIVKRCDRGVEPHLRVTSDVQLVLLWRERLPRRFGNGGDEVRLHDSEVRLVARQQGHRDQRGRAAVAQKELAHRLRRVARGVKHVELLVATQRRDVESVIGERVLPQPRAELSARRAQRRLRAAAHALRDGLKQLERQLTARTARCRVGQGCGRDGGGGRLQPALALKRMKRRGLVCLAACGNSSAACDAVSWSAARLSRRSLRWVVLRWAQTSLIFLAVPGGIRMGSFEWRAASYDS